MTDAGRNRFLTLAVCIWASAVFLGIMALARYSNKAGAQPPFTQPTFAAQTRFRLVMFAHPQCPCTRASIAELNRLMGDCDGRVRGEVYIYQAGEKPDEWSDTWIRRHADLIPEVDVITDRDAAVARSYAASTSGQVLLYDSAGGLRFSGGITAGRGHEGDNRGRSAVVEIVTGRQSPGLVETPVFGCALFSDEQTERAND